MTDTTNTNEGAPQRPDNVPEKFWNAETGAVNTDALLASYTELETSQATRAKADADAEAARVAAAAAAAVSPQVPVRDEAAYAAAVAKATEELAQSDSITDETYALLTETGGVTRAQVDTYVQGQRDANELRTLQIVGAAGGEDNYKAMVAWAVAGNYTAEEAESFNSVIFGKDKAAAVAAVATLKNRYDTDMGIDARMVTGESANKLTGGYTTKSEWLADMRKPEYKKDQSFRDEVQRKLAIAVKNNVNLGVSINRR
ncbi:capsid assembly protein [Stenotrophomonas oahuensis]|uniref:Capsid assembly protein n=1 Tax=Stenotrophomonas oahuensis TaxID=3003271 RepID=A0ABY9YNG2_9GAMM|nr:hypothetical protein [Stenotrophomonas sp. A5586]WNH52434.1 hypothetical protein PDM29_19260 [Stenotrophomonas sp. A5586]